MKVMIPMIENMPWIGFPDEIETRHIEDRRVDYATSKYNSGSVSPAVAWTPPPFSEFIGQEGVYSQRSAERFANPFPHGQAVRRIMVVPTVHEAAWFERLREELDGISKQDMVDTAVYQRRLSGEWVL